MSNTAFNERLRRISLLAALVAPMVTACGGGSGGSTETPSTPSPPPAPAPTPATPPPPPTSTTTLSLLAGNTDGAGNQDGAALTAARFSVRLGGMAVNSTGEVVIADSNNHLIRKIGAAHEQVSTLAGGGGPVRSDNLGITSNYADGNGSAARFYSPKAVAVDAAGNTYVADTDNHLVRKISTSGTVTTLAGQAGLCGNQDGVGNTARLCRPTSIAVDKAGTVYVSEINPSGPTYSSANPIRKITPAGEVSTLVSKASLYPTSVFFSGPPSDIYYPVFLAVDSAGTLYAADPNDHVIRKYAADGQATVVSGTVGENNQGSADGAASATKFGALKAIAFDAADRLFVLDNFGYPAIRRINNDGSATTLIRAQSCNTNMAPGTLCTADQMVVKADGQFLVPEYGAYLGTYKYAQLRSYTPQGASTVVAGAPSAEGMDDGLGGSARFDMPGSIALNPSGTLYVRDNNNRTIRTVQTDGVVRTLGKPGGHCASITGLGDDVLRAAYMAPLATDNAGALYSLDGARVLKTKDCQSMLLADLQALLEKAPNYITNHASGIAADNTGNVFVSTLKGAIFKIDTKGEVTLFAGSVGVVGHMDGQGAVAKFSALGNMTTDAAGNLYVIDGLFYNVANTMIGPTVRKITPSGTVSTLAGNPNAAPGYADGLGAVAVFSVSPPGSGFPLESASLAADNKGNVYVADPVNHVIRKIAPDGQVTTPVGQAWRQGFAAGDLPGIINRPAGIAIRDSMMYITVPNAVIQVKLP